MHISLQNPEEAFIATNICFLTNFTQLKMTKIQANYWWGQMHCGPPNQNFKWVMVHPAHAAAPQCMERHDVESGAVSRPIAATCKDSAAIPRDRE